MNLSTAYTFPLCKANPSKSVKIYRTSDIQSTGLIKLSNVITELNAGQTVGVITKVYESPKGDHVAYIQLYSSVGSFVYVYSHGLAYLSDLDLVTQVETATAGKTYYSTGNNVNIRKTAKVAVGNEFGTQLSKGDIIGTSDGVDYNGFYKFNLRIGGVGYVSKSYVTLQKPATVTVAKTITDPLTGKSESVQVPVITDPNSSFDMTRTVIGAIVGVVVTYSFTRIIKSFSK